jgi:sigma-B regulation protein RsbU (phosphoserine phosphatase)
MSAKILVVDDEPDLEQLIKQKFRRHIREREYEFVFATSGTEALAQLAAHQDTDIVLSDINMPNMDGLTLLAKLTELNPVLKTIMVSAYGDMDNIRSAMNRGAFDFVTKPVNFDDLEITITKTLRHVVKLKSAVKIEHEVHLAKQVQTALLPHAAPQLAGFDLAGCCLPALEVGGDYYDFIMLDDTHVAIAIADVSGKGIPAAIYMTLVKGILQSHAALELSPKDVLAKVNALIYKTFRRGSFVTMLYGVLDVSSRTFTYARAGHTPPLFISSDDHRNAPMKTKGMGLGLAPSNIFAGTIAETTLTLKPDDLLVLYTDGFTEAMSEAGEEFGDERFRDMVYTHSLKPKATDVLNAITDGVKTFAAKAPQHDDMTLIVLKALT